MTKLSTNPIPSGTYEAYVIAHPALKTVAEVVHSLALLEAERSDAWAASDEQGEAWDNYNCSYSEARDSLLDELVKLYRQEPYAVRSYLDCSTAHLPWSERCDLSRAPHYLSSDEYSDFVYVGSDDAEDADEDAWADYPVLRQVIHRARELGCNIIRFDGDGYQVPGLPTYFGQQGSPDDPAGSDQEAEVDE